MIIMTSGALASQKCRLTLHHVALTSIWVLLPLLAINNDKWYGEDITTPSHLLRIETRSRGGLVKARPLPTSFTQKWL